MAKDLNKLFDGLLARYVAIIEADYRQRMKRARDKEHMLAVFIQEAEYILKRVKVYGKANDLYNFFIAFYNAGEELNAIFSRLKEMFGDLEPVTVIRTIKGEKTTIPDYLTEESKVMQKLASDERKLLKFIIRCMAYQEITKRLPRMFTEDAKQRKAPKYPLEWTGTNKNEFVQLVYGLFKAGLINKGEGEITRTVESLAEALKVDLSDNWQSNHSSSIHRAKSGYKPEIFSKIQEAYRRYAEDQVENKRKNK